MRSETYDFPSEKGNQGADRTHRTSMEPATRRNQAGDKPRIKQAGGILRELKETERSLD